MVMTGVNAVCATTTWGAVLLDALLVVGDLVQVHLALFCRPSGR